MASRRSCLSRACHSGGGFGFRAPPRLTGRRRNRGSLGGKRLRGRGLCAGQSCRYRSRANVLWEFQMTCAGVGSSLIRVAPRGLLDAAKDLLLVANACGCGTELLRHAFVPRSSSAFLPSRTPAIVANVGSGHADTINSCRP